MMEEMTADIMRRDAHELLDRVPEEKLIYLVQIMRGMKGLAESEEQDRKATIAPIASAGGNSERGAILGSQ